MNRGKIITLAAAFAAIFSLGIYAARLLGTPTHERDVGRGSNDDRTVAAMAATASALQIEGRVLTISSESQRVSGIVTRRLPAFPHRGSIAAYGEVIDLRSLIGLRNTYTTAKAEARKAVIQLEISRNEYSRAKTIFNSTKYLSLEKLQSAEAAFDSDLADSEAAVQDLSGLKGEITQEWGTVIARWVTDNSPAAEELIDHKLTIIVLTIPPNSGINEAPRTAEVESADGKVLEATLVSFSPVSNPAIQGVTYFYSALTNPSLSVGMNVVAHLAVGRQSIGVVTPASAVVWQSGSAWVFLRTGKTNFVRKEIALTEPTEGGWFVSRGVDPGDEIVVDGAQLLLSQEFNGQAAVNN
ncbi:MAG: hypothetical protein M1469_03305 [Bacteroidetes bacterium]|nr:hypothetical protein [Bacteroidota bacterium]